MRIIFATENEGKMKEVRRIMSDMNCEVISLREAGVKSDAEETGETYEENSLIKAEAVYKLTGELVLADDSGFEVDYLDKQPGVQSARFMGRDTSYDIKNRYIIDRLKDIDEKDRTARFVAAIACCFPDGSSRVVRATMEGTVAHEIKGTNGFGYDPILYLPEYGMNSAELDMDEKNKISHRGKALRKMKEEILKWMEEHFEEDINNQ